MDSVEISQNITADLNQEGELIGVEILKASTFLSDFVLETTQAKLLNLNRLSSWNFRFYLINNLINNSHYKIPIISSLDAVKRNPGFKAIE